jgi:peptide/histidine transporter 3/4
MLIKIYYYYECNCNSRFYWSINLGAAISYVVVSYICQFGIPQLGGENWGFFVGYMIPVIFLALAVVIFIIGTPKYKMSKPNGSVIATTWGVCWNAIENYFSTSNPRRPAKVENFLDRASTSYGGKFKPYVVDSVKLVTRLVPFLFVLVPFWGIYSQMSTGFQNQGCQMNLSMGGDANVPISALNLFNTIAIVMLVPIFDEVLFPYLNKRNMNPNLLQKIGIGFLFAIAAMGLAGIIEIYRLHEKAPAGNYYDQDAKDNISPCHDIDNYNPYQYQKWQSGEVLCNYLSAYLSYIYTYLHSYIVF